MIGISKEQILMMHYALIEETGGSHGVRDEGLLDSAIAAPYASFGGEEFFPTIKGCTSCDRPYNESSHD